MWQWHTYCISAGGLRFCYSRPIGAVAYFERSSVVPAIKHTVANAMALLQTRVLRAPRKSALANRPAGTIKIVCRYAIANGIANGALYQAETLRRLGYRVEIVDISAAIKRPWLSVSASAGGLFVFHCGGAELPLLAWPLRHVLGTGYSVGYFAWESASPPRDWDVAISLVDEVWTPSHFSAETLAQVFPVPIVVAPHVVPPRGTPRQWRRGATPLIFLTMADSRSSLARKNPLGTIAAFHEAFPNESDVRLIVKLKMNGAHDIATRIAELARNDQRIVLLTNTLSQSEVDALFLSAHAFVSLHRAEGFGLPLLEAMGLGLATIATGWSGNTEFMNDDNSLLVDYRICTEHDEGGVYGTVTWADPDVSRAAAHMRRLYDDQELMAALIERSWRGTGIDKQLHRYGANLMRSRVLAPAADYSSEIAQSLTPTEQAMPAN